MREYEPLHNVSSVHSYHCDSEPLNEYNEFIDKCIHHEELSRNKLKNLFIKNNTQDKLHYDSIDIPCFDWCSQYN